MWLCAYCRTPLLISRIKCAGKIFCCDDCLKRYAIRQAAPSISDEVIEANVREIHEGVCAICGGSGPVDVHRSYRVISFIIISQYGSFQQLSCRWCGTKAKLKEACITFFMGWWALPGIFLTPPFVLANMFGVVAEFFCAFGAPEPSSALKKLVANQLALEAFANAEEIKAGDDG